MKSWHDGKSEVWELGKCSLVSLWGKIFSRRFSGYTGPLVPILLLSDASLGLLFRRKCSWYLWATEMNKNYKGSLTQHRLGPMVFEVCSRWIYWRQSEGHFSRSQLLLCHGFSPHALVFGIQYAHIYFKWFLVMGANIYWVVSQVKGKLSLTF